MGLLDLAKYLIPDFVGKPLGIPGPLDSEAKLPIAQLPQDALAPRNQGTQASVWGVEPTFNGSTAIPAAFTDITGLVGTLAVPSDGTYVLVWTVAGAATGANTNFGLRLKFTGATNTIIGRGADVSDPEQTNTVLPWTGAFVTSATHTITLSNVVDLTAGAHTVQAQFRNLVGAGALDLVPDRAQSLTMFQVGGTASLFDEAVVYTVVTPTVITVAGAFEQFPEHLGKFISVPASGFYTITVENVSFFNNLDGSDAWAEFQVDVGGTLVRNSSWGLYASRVPTGTGRATRAQTTFSERVFLPAGAHEIKLLWKKDGDVTGTGDPTNDAGASTTIRIAGGAAFSGALLHGDSVIYDVATSGTNTTTGSFTQYPDALGSTISIPSGGIYDIAVDVSFGADAQGKATAEFQLDVGGQLFRTDAWVAEAIRTAAEAGGSQHASFRVRALLPSGVHEVKLLWKEVTDSASPRADQTRDKVAIHVSGGASVGSVVPSVNQGKMEEVWSTVGPATDQTITAGFDALQDSGAAALTAQYEALEAGDYLVLWTTQGLFASAGSDIQYTLRLDITGATTAMVGGVSPGEWAFADENAGTNLRRGTNTAHAVVSLNRGTHVFAALIREDSAATINWDDSCYTKLVVVKLGGSSQIVQTELANSLYPVGPTDTTWNASNPSDYQEVGGATASSSTFTVPNDGDYTIAFELVGAFRASGSGGVGVDYRILIDNVEEELWRGGVVSDVHRGSMVGAKVVTLAGGQHSFRLEWRRSSAATTAQARVDDKTSLHVRVTGGAAINATLDARGDGNSKERSEALEHQNGSLQTFAYVLVGGTSRITTLRALTLSVGSNTTVGTVTGKLRVNGVDEYTVVLNTSTGTVVTDTTTNPVIPPEATIELFLEASADYENAAADFAAAVLEYELSVSTIIDAIPETPYRMNRPAVGQVLVAPLLGAVLSYRMENGNTYTSPVARTFDFANGTGTDGLDSGAEANDTWYYLYAVPSTGTQLELKASTIDPRNGGPVGLTIWRYLGAFYNDVSGNILPFHQAGSRFTLEVPVSEYSPGAGDHAVHDVTLANIPLTAGSAILLAAIDSGSSVWYVAGQAAGFWQQNNLAGATEGFFEIPVPGIASKVIRHQSLNTPVSTSVSSAGWVDEYMRRI